jgi:D-alanyl-D-alanine carboxypeptidase (penicillin-binding protein 5/6)
VENLLKGIVTLSGNDASVVLAECIAGTEQAFTDQMNTLAKRIGLTNSHFGTANGWPDNGVTYVSARDLAKLADWEIEHHYKLYKQFYSLPSFTWGKTMGAGQDITQANRNPILGHVQGADGLKTGHTDEAGYGFTGSAEQNGRRLIEVLAGMDSWNQRVTESTRLILWGFNAWNDKPLFKAGDKVGTAQVQLGSSSEVPLVAPRNLSVSVPAALSISNDKPFTMKVRYQGPLVAPISKGQEVAQLIVNTGDGPPQIVPLVAGEDVGKAGFFGRIWLGLKRLI